jgi:hypothetical protein
MMYEDVSTCCNTATLMDSCVRTARSLSSLASSVFNCDRNRATSPLASSN